MNCLEAAERKSHPKSNSLMAIVIENKSKCALCDKVITDTADAIAFPAFLPQQHRLSKFSDAVFHRACFEGWRDRDDFQSVYEDLGKQADSLKDSSRNRGLGKGGF
jgi:hypothetical protein